MTFTPEKWELPQIRPSICEKKKRIFFPWDPNVGTTIPSPSWHCQHYSFWSSRRAGSIPISYSMISGPDFGCRSALDQGSKDSWGRECRPRASVSPRSHPPGRSFESVGCGCSSCKGSGLSEREGQSCGHSTWSLAGQLSWSCCCLAEVGMDLSHSFWNISIQKDHLHSHCKEKNGLHLKLCLFAHFLESSIIVDKCFVIWNTLLLRVGVNTIWVYAMPHHVIVVKVRHLIPHLSLWSRILV